MTEPAKTCPQCNSTMPEGSTSSLCAKCLLQVGFETDPGPASDSESRAYQPTFIAPTTDELAPHFPQLEILEQIGHGGMGVVYKARQTELDRIVALKILRPNISNDVSFAERFQREARALAKLNHPNIITIYDFGRKDGLYFFIMEYVDGTNLRHVERTGQLSPQEALSIVPQVCSALQYAHDNGVVHRDIKPENILITKSGDVRIADFGLAKLAGMKDEAPLTGTWQVMGTPHYMAPEQFEKPTTVDHRADIYSLGVVIYELLTGELPLGRFLLPSEKVRVDVRLDDVVLRSLAKEPERRYQRVTDVATAVRDASAEQPMSKPASIQSLFGQAKSMGAQAAAATAEHVGSVLNKAGPLAVNRRGSGTMLMWVSALNLAFVLFSMTRFPSHDEVRLLSFIEGVASGIAFWFAREFRRGTVSKSLWWLAVCSLPWVAIGLLFSLARVVLTIVLLRASRDGMGESGGKNDNAADSSRPDFVDKAIAAVRKSRSVVTPRMLLLTFSGIVGWCLAWGLPTVAVGIFWFSPYSSGQLRRPQGPSTADMVLVGVAASLWLIGFVRVLRVLYRHLWKSSVPSGSDALIRARSDWRSCCRALAVSAAVAGTLAAFMSYSLSPAVLFLPAEVIDEIPKQLNSRSFTTRMCMLLSGSIAAGALLARPVFRNAGRSIGLLTSGMAMVVVPISLITFPSGLAAWILLTDPAVRQLFSADETNNSRELV